MGTRTHGPRAGVLLVPLLLLGAACGGFNNAPLGVGNVVGRVVGADPAVARVSVHVSDDAPRDDDDDGGSDGGVDGGVDADDEDTFVTGVDADGRFVLRDVPATHLELYVVASATQAARRQVWVEGGRTTDVGDIVPEAGAAVRVQVLDAGGQPVPGALVRVDETSFEELPVDASGTVVIGPLPPACFQLRAKAEGYEEARATHCLEAGRTLDVTLVLPVDD